MSSENEFLTNALMSETRRNIVISLLESPKHISQIARELEVDRSTASYHLNLLEKIGMVSQEYKVIEEPNSPSGKVGSFFKVNKEVLAKGMELAIKALTIPSEEQKPL